MFEGPPQAFYKNIVYTPSPAIHADGYMIALKNVDKSSTGELGTLIGVENFWDSVTNQRLFKSFHTKGRVHGVGDSPGQNLSAVSVYNGYKVHEPPIHGDIGNIGGPNFV